MIVLKIIPSSESNKIPLVPAGVLRNGGGVFPFLSIPISSNSFAHKSFTGLVDKKTPEIEELKNLVDRAILHGHTRLLTYLKEYTGYDIPSNIVVEYIYRNLDGKSNEEYASQTINLLDVLREGKGNSGISQVEYLLMFMKKIKNRKYFPELYISVMDLLLYREVMLAENKISDIDELEYYNHYLSESERAIIYE